ncbi:ATP-binding cassette domain-containing protein [Paenibacillus sp. IB182496]|uniref:ATP-binding cassette domain-containing protein n=1 Tax=Paenibacillus sabuli TaxID=2772509 RepID=A0A927BR38_9BACL|nr:ATP-binding cassette domain-containing protein [Paenibacillus sabuli]MBD2845201.1 ATP-binding cassette domain-containing protein [Paenibacillus sabuli]
MALTGSWVIDELQIASPGSAAPRVLLQIERLQLDPGRLYLVTGRSGAGKTTLLESLAGLREPASGRIELGGRSLWSKRRPVRELLLQLGVSLQHSESQWFASTVREELNYSLRPYRTRSRAAELEQGGWIEALGRSGLAADVLDRDPWSLSGGEQRRLALACVMACQPDWLLLDEPTAGLDRAGAAQLRASLARHVRAGGGAIVVTHEPWLLAGQCPHVILSMADGRLSGQGQAMAAHPQSLAAAAQALREAGFRLPAEPPTPTQLARQIAEQLRPPDNPTIEEALAAEAPRSARKEADEAENAPLVREHTADVLSRQMPQPDASPQPNVSMTRVAAAEPDPAERHSWSRFDPRALWGGYVLLTAGILQQQTWLGLGAAAAACAYPLWRLRSCLLPWQGLIRGYSVMLLLVALLAGLQLQPLQLELESSLVTAQRLTRLLLVMLLGIPLTQLVSPLRLKRALEQVLRPLGRLGLRLETFTLLIALIFRFVPLQLAQWERFARIAQARGKSGAKPGRIPLRELHRVLIPFMMSLLRLADQMTTALQVRGFGSGRSKTQGWRLRMGSGDGLLLGAAAGIASLLWLLQQWLSAS